MCNVIIYGLAQQPDAKAQVIINGQTLSEEQVRLLERTVGIVVQPGHYIINVQNGCWANLTKKTRGCLGQTGFSKQRFEKSMPLAFECNLISIFELSTRPSHFH